MLVERQRQGRSRVGVDGGQCGPRERHRDETTVGDRGGGVFIGPPLQGVVAVGDQRPQQRVQTGRETNQQPITQMGMTQMAVLVRE